jgi:polyhydroxyalkanoate synthesis regulator phasin
MRILTILSLLLFASSAYGELTKEDIRTIIKEENAVLEKRMKEYIDLKIDGVEKSLNARIDVLEKSLNARIDGLDKRMDNMWRLMIGLFGLVAATIAIPQIIIAYRDRGRKEMQAQIDQLRAQIEALQNTPS